MQLVCGDLGRPVKTGGSDAARSVRDVDRLESLHIADSNVDVRVSEKYKCGMKC